MDTLKEGLLDKAEEIRNNLPASEQIDVWFDQYVPAEGKAETVGGEIIRAISRIGHRWNNDGDKVGVEYGNETCNSAACYLLKYVPGFYDDTFDYSDYSINSIIEEFNDFLQYVIGNDVGCDDVRYEVWLNNIYELIVNYLRAHSDLFETPAEESYDDFYSTDWEGSYAPRFCSNCGDYILERGDIYQEDEIWEKWRCDSSNDESEMDADYQSEMTNIVEQYTDNYNGACCPNCADDCVRDMNEVWDKYQDFKEEEDEENDEDYGDSDDE